MSAGMYDNWVIVSRCGRTSEWMPEIAPVMNNSLVRIEFPQSLRADVTVNDYMLTMRWCLTSQWVKIFSGGFVFNEPKTRLFSYGNESVHLSWSFARMNYYLCVLVRN